MLAFFFYTNVIFLSEVPKMRGDIKDLIDFITKEELPMYNKAELAWRYGCDPRTIVRYLNSSEYRLPLWAIVKHILS